MKEQNLLLANNFIQENSEEWLQAAVPDWLKNTFYRWQHTNTLLEQQPIEVQEVLKPAMQKAQEIIMQEMAAEIQDYQGKDGAIIKSQEWRLKAKALKMKLSLLSIDGLGYLGDLKQKFSETKELDRSQITTRPDLFQGRQVAFSQETVDKIMREGYDKSQEPIAVWLDPKSKKYVLISGHSRWHASELLYNKGQKNLKTMSVKVFNGNLEEAQDFAILESNRSGTAEGLKYDLSAYKRTMEKGKSKDYLLSTFKTEARIRLLQDISYLNTKGLFLEYMGEDAEKSFPYLQRNTQWVGILRRLYPSLTSSHEKELFDYLYGSISAITLKKDTFFNLIEKKASR